MIIFTICEKLYQIYMCRVGVGVLSASVFVLNTYINVNFHISTDNDEPKRIFAVLVSFYFLLLIIIIYLYLCILQIIIVCSIRYFWLWHYLLNCYLYCNSSCNSINSTNLYITLILCYYTRLFFLKFWTMSIIKF